MSRNPPCRGSETSWPKGDGRDWAGSDRPGLASYRPAGLVGKRGGDTSGGPPVAGRASLVRRGR